MTIPSITNSAANDGSNAISVDVSLAISADTDRVLVAFPALFEGGSQSKTVSSVTFDPGGGDEDSFTYETFVNQDTGGDRWRQECWYLLLDDGVADGTYTIRATMSASTNRVSIAAWEVADADTTDPIGANGTAAGDSAAVSVTVTTTATNSLVGAGAVHRANTNFTATAGTEVTDRALNFMSQYTAYTNAAATGDHTLSADVASAGEWAMLGVEILEAGGAPPPAGPQLLALLGVGE